MSKMDAIPIDKKNRDLCLFLSDGNNLSTASAMKEIKLALWQHYFIAFFKSTFYNFLVCFNHIL